MDVTNWYLSFMSSNFGRNHFVISNQTCPVCSFDFEIRYTISDLTKTMKNFSNAIGYHQPDLSTEVD